MKSINALEVPLVQGSQAWHEWRLQGIGGSDAAVINGTSPYRTPRELFLEKTGQAVAEDDKSKEFIFAKGHRTEALIRSEFQKKINSEILPVCFQHPKFSHFRASLDGFNAKHGVLEAKLVGKEVLKSASDGVIPKHHFTQMQHQLLVTGADIGNWFGHDGKKNGVVVPIRADLKFIKLLEDLENRFWEDVQSKKAPPLTEQDYLVPDDLKLLIELREAKELAENAEANYKAIREHAVNFYNHPKIAGAGIKLFKVNRAGSLELKSVPEIASALAKLDEEYLESFRKKGSESWTIQIEKKRSNHELRSN